MAQRKGGLGRGLSALIPGATSIKQEEGIAKTNITEIPLKKIIPNKNQPRKVFNQDSLNELADSIREFGIIQPIMVRKLDSDGQSYEIISGERRFKAAKILGMKAINCIINQNIDDLASLEMALIENIQRDNLTPIELSHTFRQLVDEFKLTHEELSIKVGASRSAITNSLRLLLLPVEVQILVDSEKISAGHARALLGLEHKKEQIILANDIVEHDFSVRETEKLVNKRNKNIIGKKPAKKLKLLQLDKLSDVEKAVSEFLETPVKIKVGKNKGSIEILFGSIKDFERIVHKIIGSRQKSSQ
jgi:ParB family transcriptional regulator, chromosome partitioning protein